MKNPFLLHRWKWCWTAGLLVALIQFPVKQMQNGERKTGNIFFNHENDLTKVNGNLYSMIDHYFRWKNL